MKVLGCTRVYAVLIGICLTAFCLAQMTPPDILGDGRIDKTKGVGVVQQVGSQVPGNAVFTDVNGRKVTLSQYFGKRPIVLNLMYYNCKATCTLITEGLLDSFAKMRESRTAHDLVGKDVDVITLSINPNEKPKDARKDKSEILSILDYPSASKGWHFLTGSMSNIQKVVSAVGFHYTLDRERNLINHPAVVVILTPTGKVSQYFFGSAYPEIPLHDAINLASKDLIGKKKQEILLGCFCIDPLTGKYTADVDRILKVFGSGFAVLVGASIFVMSRQKPKYELVDKLHKEGKL